MNNEQLIIINNNMKRYVIYVWGLAGAMMLGAFTGCNDQSDVDTVKTDRIPVKLGVTLENSSRLKVTQDYRWEDADRIGLYMKVEGVPIFDADAVYQDADNLQMRYYTSNSQLGKSTAFSDELYFPNKQDRVDFIAYYPYKASIDADYTFAVDLEDQSARLADDLLYSNNLESVEPEEELKQMVFKYCLAKIQLTVYTRYHSQANAGAMTVSLVGMDTKAKFHLDDGTFSDIQGGQPIRMLKTDGATYPDVGLGDDAVYYGGWATYEALVLPADVDDNAKFVISVGGKNYEVSAEREYVAGGLYRLNYAFNDPSDEFVHVTDFSISQASASLVISHRFKLTATVTPSNAFYNDVTWESDKPDIAYVDNNYGLNVEVVAKGEGVATITATSRENSDLKQTCTVTVSRRGNRLMNPGFEEPNEPLGSTTSYTTGFNNNYDKIRWTPLTTDWYSVFYKSGEEMAGPYGLGPGNGGGANTNRVGNDDPSFLYGTGNGSFMGNMGYCSGSWACRVGGNAGANSGGIYQLLYVEPGATYRMGMAIGMRTNDANQAKVEYETLKILSWDGFTVYHLLPYPMNENPWELWNNWAATCMRISGLWTAPEGVTEVRWQVDTRHFGGQNNKPLTIIDDCVFELVE